MNVFQWDSRVLNQAYLHYDKRACNYCLLFIIVYVHRCRIFKIEQCECTDKYTPVCIKGSYHHAHNQCTCDNYPWSQVAGRGPRSMAQPKNSFVKCMFNTSKAPFWPAWCTQMYRCMWLTHSSGQIFSWYWWTCTTTFIEVLRVTYTEARHWMWWP